MQLEISSVRQLNRHLIMWDSELQLQVTLIMVDFLVPLHSHLLVTILAQYLHSLQEHCLELEHQTAYQGLGLDQVDHGTTYLRAKLELRTASKF